MKKYISKFHYLTQDLPDRSHTQQVQTACEAGANWVQYRCLTKTDEELIEEINDLAAIRAQIGQDKTLGASATNIKRLLSVQALSVVDYCGYGPFAHTTTKLNDKPLLGFEGYELLQRHQLQLPVLAVGGIKINDVEPLMKTGIYGVAVSSAVNLSDDPASTVKTIYKKIY